MTKPDFIGIGAQRSGTTWLHKALSNHKSVWLPPVKEVHYFDRKYPIVSDDGSTFSRTKSSHILFRLSRFNSKNIIRKLRYYKPADFAWDYKYYSGSLDDEWYRSLYIGHDNEICGDITPAYSILDIEGIRSVYRYNSNIKIIVLLRNPIDRAWSHFLKDYSDKTIDAYNDLSLQTIRKHITSKASLLRGDYIKIIDSWTSVFPREQILIRFYDEIVHDPTSLLKAIYIFLGLSCTESELVIDRHKVNASKSSQMPALIRSELSNIYSDSIQMISERYGSYAEDWLREVDQ